MADPQVAATPVEGNPFQPQVADTPVEGDPFAPAVPQSFLSRLATGEALGARVLGAAAKGAAEGFGSAPIGFSPDSIKELQRVGIYSDPATGRGGPVRLFNESVMQPLAALGDVLQRSFNAGIYAVGEGAGQAVNEAGGALGNPEEARNEIVNLGNYLLARGDHQFSRVADSGGQAVEQHIGGLPTGANFKDSAAVVGTAPAEDNLRALWNERGIHPAEATHDASSDAMMAHDLAVKQEPAHIADAADQEALEATGKPASLGAAANDLPEDVSPLVQPPQAPGRLLASLHGSLDNLFSLGRDAQMLVSPMATGTTDSMALAKDFANAMRRNRWDWSRIDTDIAERFTPEQRERMWNAADEESVALQLGESREHQGLVTLEPEERVAVEALQSRAQLSWMRARDMGMVEGEGLPAYTPRMLINVANASADQKALPLNGIGANLRTTTAQLRGRKYMTAEETEAAGKARLGEQAEIARDIRTLPLATARLDDAIAGRKLIDAIKEYGQRTGDETVAEGGIPSGTSHKWFTLDHPAFRRWRPKLEETETQEMRDAYEAKTGIPLEGKRVPVIDRNGNTVFEQTPIYVRSDFEGPLRAVLSQKNGPLYSAMIGLKGKTMGLIMNSPLIHNAVEWGRALPAMPGKVASFKIYFDGNRVKNDPVQMGEAIDNGLVPIGQRFFNQNVDDVMKEPDLTPGRSWTAKLIGAVPGLFDAKAGAATKRAIDKAGDFWHNTLLWDRVGDLQAGLYSNFRDDLLAKGVDRQTAARAAAHWANRYAGALPQEAMSANARKIANMLLFSRSYTLGNLGAIKDAMTGLPRDVSAQIERDTGEVNPEAAGYIKSLARRKAVAVIATDIGLFYAGNSVLQSALSVMLGDSTMDQEMHGYAQRLSAALSKVREHPLSLLQPFNFFQSLSATGANEPERQDRILVGYAKDGTGIYARNPSGKIGEEFIGYLTGPLDMLRRKLGTIAKPAWQILSNDKGFGRKIYDENADTPAKYIENAAKIAETIFGAQLPTGQAGAFSDLVSGQGDAKVNALQALGPLFGVTFSKGAPGGPAVGELYKAREQHDYAVQAAMPGIRRLIQNGDVDGARNQMTNLGIPPGLQRFYIRTTANPATRLRGRTLRDFYQYATPDQKDRLERAVQTTPVQ